MSKINFSLEIKKRFSPTEWPWVLMALREDEGVWTALENSDLGKRALEELPPEYRAWSPAALAFLSLGIPGGLEAMKSIPLQPLEESLFHQASQVYEDWVKNQRSPKDLSDAGLLALIFREQFRLSGSWREGLGLGEIEPIASRTSLACLYGMVPEPMGLLRALAQVRNTELARLAVHVLLANPSSPETQLILLKELAAQLDPSFVLIMLKALSASRPHLALLLARQVIDASSSTWGAELGERNDSEGVSQLEQLIRSLRTAQVHQIAGQAELAVPVLSDSLRLIRKTRAHLSAQLAHAVAKTKDLTTESWGDTARVASVEAWKQAVLLTPDEPVYAAGYARALQNSGRFMEAVEYLRGYLEEEKRPPNPELLLLYTFTLVELGNEEKASQFALKSLDLLVNGQVLSEQDIVLLSKYLAKINLHQEALKAAQTGLAVYPASRELLALEAKSYALLGQPDDAISAAYAALASEQCEFPVVNEHDVVEHDEHLDALASCSNSLESLEIQRLLVESLEAVQAWETAYQERVKLLEGQKNPSEVDLWALAISAYEANKFEKVIQICRQLLENAPDRLPYHQKLAEAAEALGDYLTAIEHYNRSIQLAPDKSALWKGLYRAQKTAGPLTAAYETLRAASQALPDDPDIQFELGELYLSQGAPTLALPCFRRAYGASQSGERSLNTAIRLGETLHQIGRQDEARQILGPVHEVLSAAMRTLPPASGESNLGSKISPEMAHVYAKILLELKEPEKSVPILTYVVRERPSDPRPCLDLSKGLMMLSDQVSGAKRALPFLHQVLGYNENSSVNPYSSAIEADPELHAEALALLAEAYTAAGEWEKGLEAYRRALEEPANRESTKQTRLSLGLGLTALKLELPEMAVAALEEAAHSEPLNGQIQRSLSEAYLSNGLTLDAFQAAQTALELAPMDMNVLIWFVEQGLRIAQMPGAAASSIHSEIIRALKTALSQAPERADLLIKLGSLLLQTGKKEEALEAFRKLAALDTVIQRIEVADIYHSALAVLEAGDARLAAALLRKAIFQLEGTGDSAEKPKDQVLLADLYDALVRALEQLGDMEGALDAISQALNLEKTRLAFHLTRSDLLFKIGKYEEARTGLDYAIKQWPENARLRGRMGRVLRALGDLPAALVQVELGIAYLEEMKDKHLEEELFHQAAKLAFATLRPRRAFAYLQKAISEDDPDFNRYENAIFRAELALEAGEEIVAAHAIAMFEAQSVETPRALAASGRLACRRGERDVADHKCRSAVREWTRQQMGGPGITPATTVDDFISELTSIGMAALENRLWDEAQSIFQQMVVMFPDEPLAHFKLAEVMLICAEAQALCQDVEVVKRAPGTESLLEPARIQFEERLDAAAMRAGCPEILKPDGVLEDWDVEIKRSLGLCSRRGRAVFQPILENAAALEYLLQTVIPDTEDLVSLIMAYRRCGEKDRAVKSLHVGWHPVFEGKDFHSDPRVMIQLALADTDLQNAIETVKGLIEPPCDQGTGWPEPAMLKFLLAKFCMAANDLPAAQVAIQRALNEWPDEPRWQALAAKILTSQPAPNRLQQLAEAIGYYEKAAELEPDYSNHQLELGQIYLESGQTRPAIQALEQATRLDPRNAAGWLALAKAQFSADDLEQAAISAERAIEQTDDPLDALLLRAEIALQTGNHRGALSRAQTVLRSRPEQPSALYILAKALDGLNRPAEALDALELALPHFENPIPMQLERLKLIKRSQNLEAGLKALQELVAQNPKQAAFLALLADWLQEAGKQDAAVQAARLALQEGLEGLSLKQRADLHTMIGLHMRRTGQLDQAIHHLSEAIVQSSDHLDAYLELGRVYQDRREYQQALKVYQKAINLAGGDYRPYYQAGLVLKDNKDYMAAEAMLRRATQLAPNEVSVHRLLGAVVALNLVHSRRLIPGEARAD